MSRSPLNIRPLSPQEASDYLLKVHGVKASKSTLASWRRNGNGPRWRRNGPRLVNYEPEDLDIFSLSRLSPPQFCTAAVAEKAA